MPQVRITSDLQKILQGHSLRTLHPSAKFRSSKLIQFPSRHTQNVWKYLLEYIAKWNDYWLEIIYGYICDTRRYTSRVQITCMKDTYKENNIHKRFCKKRTKIHTIQSGMSQTAISLRCLNNHQFSGIILLPLPPLSSHIVIHINCSTVYSYIKQKMKTCA